MHSISMKENEREREKWKSMQNTFNALKISSMAMYKS